MTDGETPTRSVQSADGVGIQGSVSSPPPAATMQNLCVCVCVCVISPGTAEQAGAIYYHGAPTLQRARDTETYSGRGGERENSAAESGQGQAALIAYLPINDL